MLFLTAGWCPACSERMPDMVRLAAEQADAGVEVVYALSQTPDYAPADAEYCQQYVSRYEGARLDRFFFDHDGTKSFPSIFSRIWRYPAADGTFPLPWVGVIDPRTMTYVFAEPANDGRTLDAVIEELLARP